MTVEATLLLPMVLCILVAAIYAAFLLYDRCMFYQDAYLLCLRESYRREDGEPSVDTNAITEASDDFLSSKYCAVDEWSGAASADGLWAVFEGTAIVSPAAFGDYFLMPEDIWTVSFSAKSRKTDPAWSIRNWRRKSHVIESGLKYLTDYTEGE